MAIAFPASSFAEGLDKSLRAAVGRDSLCNVWVFFKDRPARGGTVPISDKAALRRARAGYRGGEGDRPVDQYYIREVERLGGRLRHTFDWENAASFSVHSSQLDSLSKLKFVKSISPVAVYIRKELDKNHLRKAAASLSTDGYGWHMEMVNVPLAHEYIKSRKIGDPGHGVYAAFFDTGFELWHRAFSHARDNGLIVATYSFVNNAVPVNNGDTHGAQCLSLVAARHHDTYIGAAWGARFALAHTEDAGIEARIEEDNWARAVVWAESLGVRIISSSLGYREGYDNPGDNYGFNDMDGKTTMISLAAKGAIERGVIVVNSMGNEGQKIGEYYSLTAPADVEGVVSVGAVSASGQLASFSSGGPTFDGRVKPDVVAPGIALQIPEPHTESGYTPYGQGTSFSAPIVSGIMALILQTHPNITPDSARARLYESCAPSPFQTSEFEKNKYGRGIPDAIRAIMGKDEIFVKLTDKSGTPLQGAQAIIGANAYTADEFGGIIARAQKPLDTVTISFRDETLHVFTVNANELPFADAFSFDVKTSLKIYPTVVRRNGVVKGRYYFPPANSSKSAHVIIRALNGRTLWNQSLPIMPDGSARFEWAPSRMASGIYLLTIRHGNALLSQKIIVRN